MTAFKRSQSKYVRKSFKTTNWPEYEAGLRQRDAETEGEDRGERASTG